MANNNQNVAVLEETDQHKECICGSKEFTSTFGDTWKKHDVEIFECKCCQKSYTEEFNEKTEKIIFVYQRTFPK